MKKIIFWTLTISTIVMGLFFGNIWFNRLGLEYNSKGRYFDEASSVVYEKNAMLVYGILTLLFIVIGIISWVITLKSKQTTKI